VVKKKGWGTLVEVAIRSFSKVVHGLGAYYGNEGTYQNEAPGREGKTEARRLWNDHLKSQLLGHVLYDIVCLIGGTFTYKKATLCCLYAEGKIALGGR